MASQEAEWSPPPVRRRPRQYIPVTTLPPNVVPVLTVYPANGDPIYVDTLRLLVFDPDNGEPLLNLSRWKWETSKEMFRRRDSSGDSIAPAPHWLLKIWDHDQEVMGSELDFWDDVPSAEQLQLFDDFRNGLRSLGDISPDEWHREVYYVEESYCKVRELGAALGRVYVCGEDDGSREMLPPDNLFHVTDGTDGPEDGILPTCAEFYVWLHHVGSDFRDWDFGDGASDVERDRFHVLERSVCHLWRMVSDVAMNELEPQEEQEATKLVTYVQRTAAGQMWGGAFCNIIIKKR